MVWVDCSAICPIATHCPRLYESKPHGAISQGVFAHGTRWPRRKDLRLGARTFSQGPIATTIGCDSPARRYPNISPSPLQPSGTRLAFNDRRVAHIVNLPSFHFKPSPPPARLPRTRPSFFPKSSHELARITSLIQRSTSTHTCTSPGPIKP